MKSAPFRFGKSDLPRLGRSMRELRLASGRTQAEVAALAGLAESTVGAVEGGRSNPSLPTMVALAAALGVSIDRLVTEATRSLGRVSVTRANAGNCDLSAGLVNPVLMARSMRLLQGARIGPVPDGSEGAAMMVLVLDGVVQASVAGGERLRLETGDALHAREGALGDLAGLGAQAAQLLCVTDTRCRTRTE